MSTVVRIYENCMRLSKKKTLAAPFRAAVGKMADYTQFVADLTEALGERVTLTREDFKAAWEDLKHAKKEAEKNQEEAIKVRVDCR